MLFIDESQVTFLEDMMSERGYLDAKQMAVAFQMMRSNDLIWSRSIHDYLVGEPSFPSTSWPGTPMRHACRSACIRNIYGRSF